MSFHYCKLSYFKEVITVCHCKLIVSLLTLQHGINVQIMFSVITAIWKLQVVYIDMLLNRMLSKLFYAGKLHVYQTEARSA